MKTAMQELYDWVEQRDFYISKEWLKVLLQKEKEQIIDAYGQPRVYYDDEFKQMDEINGEQYYNLTFKKD